MAGERTKKIKKISITITDETGKRRTITNLHDYNITGPEIVEKRTPDVQGNTFLRKLEDNSGDLKITVKAGTQDEKFLDRIVNESLAFDVNIVDESSVLNSKQYDLKECYIKQYPEDSVREMDNRTYEIIASEVKRIQL